MTATIGSVILLGLVTFIVSRDKNSKYAAAREQSLQLSEAGIYWYRWYLAHNVEGKTVQQKKDFWASGTAVGTQPGGYTADVNDPEGGAIGKYKLEVTAPNADSTIVTVKSTGWTDKSPNVKRTIQARFRQPAWCEYAVVADDFMRFGEGTEVFGMVHSNQGIRFDGLAHNIISSSVPTVDDPDHCEHYNWHGDCDLNRNEFGVHTHKNPPPQTGIDGTFRPNEAPPTDPMQTRSDVFQAGRKVNQPTKSFNSLVANLGLMRDEANAGGLYLGQLTVPVKFHCRFVHSVWTCDETDVPVKGYHIVLKDNHTMDVSIVLGFDASTYEIRPTITVNYKNHNYTVEGELESVNYPVPGNGIVFVENYAWVEGTVNGDHLTIAAADLSPTPVYKDIYINHDILYTDKVGTDANGPDILGLIAQNNISIGLYSEDMLEIDAALLAQKGRIGRDNYSWANTGRFRDTITVYGSLVTKQRYGFSWINSVTGLQVSGYTNRNLYFDNNLIYYPPPYFPVGDKYQIDLWQEL
ncbi:MAG: hypothetical protein WC285_06100 [Candidatus Gracilibacteria bacterium]|jgi:hypothetical protein